MAKKIREVLISTGKIAYLHPNGGLAQLARALQWHCRGHRFESDILHQTAFLLQECGFFISLSIRSYVRPLPAVLCRLQHL